MPDFDLNSLPHAWGGPVASGILRDSPEDFQVDEALGFEPDGAGEHWLLQVRKRGVNTEWVARQLARLCGVRPAEVSYAGLKDRHAVTTQWFSVHQPKGAEPDWAGFNCAEFELLSHSRHRRKLRRGALLGNRFVLVVRQLQGDAAALEQRLGQLRGHGVPNYFGPQRFGHGHHNLDLALGLFRGASLPRPQRSLALSAARSLLFNAILARRVTAGTWNSGLDGDVMQLQGSHSVFRSETLDDTLRQRLAEGDIHPAAPLWGRGPRLSQGPARGLEDAVLAEYPEFVVGLEHAGLELDHRAQRVSLPDLTWEFPEPDSLRLSFALPAGAYATVVVREAVAV